LVNLQVTRHRNNYYTSLPYLFVLQIIVNGYTVLTPKRLLTVQWAQQPHHVTTKNRQKKRKSEKPYFGTLTEFTEIGK
jgi:hypothetical protein